MTESVGAGVEAPTTFMRRVTGPFREFGLGVGTLYAADRVLSRISGDLRLFVYEFVVQPVATKALLPEHRARGYEFRQIARDDPDVERMPARVEIKQQRFDQGAVCLGTYKRGMLIGYVWFAFRAHDEDEVRCTYELAEPDRSVFDFDVYLFPEHRMGVGFTAIWHGANEYLRERGIDFTFSRMTRFNLGSRRAHARLGQRRVARAVFVRAWRWQLMLATTRPFICLSRSERHRPTLVLHADGSAASR